MLSCILCVVWIAPLFLILCQLNPTTVTVILSYQCQSHFILSPDPFYPHLSHFIHTYPILSTPIPFYPIPLSYPIPSHMLIFAEQPGSKWAYMCLFRGWWWWWWQRATMLENEHTLLLLWWWQRVTSLENERDAQFCRRREVGEWQRATRLSTSIHARFKGGGWWSSNGEGWWQAGDVGDKKTLLAVFQATEEVGGRRGVWVTGKDSKERVKKGVSMWRGGQIPPHHVWAWRWGSPTRVWWCHKSFARWLDASLTELVNVVSNIQKPPLSSLFVSLRLCWGGTCPAVVARLSGG